jgi:hypothetical protein
MAACATMLDTFTRSGGPRQAPSPPDGLRSGTVFFTPHRPTLRGPLSFPRPEELRESTVRLD